MPPSAFSAVTASSVVGVVAKPMFTTLQPIPVKVETTIELTIGPEIRASRPTTTVGFCLPELTFTQVAKAAAYFTRSMGLRPSPGCPPMVPRIPEIDLISVTLILF